MPELCLNHEVRWIDTHCHLNDEKFATQENEIIQRAQAAAVERILVVGIDLPSSQKAVALAEEYDGVFAVVGLQPNYVADATETDMAAIAALAAAPKVVAIGETGLDRYWDHSPFDRQQHFFLQHLCLAHDLGLPVVIHCREAGAEVVSMLTDFTESTGQPIKGVMHSFTGDMPTAQACLTLGLHLSFAGMITYKTGDSLRKVAAALPIERLLVETDAPYLAPVPVRGKINEPAYIVHTGTCLAKAINKTVDDIARHTTANARALFRLPYTE